MAVGRISGPLLKANLLRDGVDLAFETSLLYLDVNNSRIGINTSSPDYDLDVNGYVRTTDLRVSGALSNDSLTVSGNTISSINDITLSPATGGVVYQGTINAGNIEINNNTISTTSGNLEISPNGSGTTQIYSNTKIWGDLEVTGDINADGDVRISGNITLVNQSSGSINFAAGISSDILPTLDNQYNLGSNVYNWKDLYAYNLYVGSISVSGNTITTRTAGTDLLLSGNGTGSVNIEDVIIKDYTISSNTDLVLQTYGTGKVVINSSQSIQIPSGDNSQRPTSPSSGMIRFNTESHHYEGYNGVDWIIIDGVYDADRNTYITAELTPGANDNTIRFYNNGSLTADLDSTRLRVNRLQAGVVDITNDTITTSTANGNLYITSNGSGKVIIDSLQFTGSTIYNPVPNGATILRNDNGGYVQIAGTYGFVLPVGNNLNRITSPSNPIGLTRYNTDDKRAEIWDGHEWISIAGQGAGVVQQDADTIAILSVFTFG
jgi:cytoskeletal protein CcmA (bactofilin family)